MSTKEVVALSATARDGLLDWAVKTGRVPEKDRVAWASAYDRDPNGTAQRLGRIGASASSTSSASAGDVVRFSDVFPPLAEGQTSVTLCRRDYLIMRSVAERQSKALTAVGAAASALPLDVAPVAAPAPLVAAAGELPADPRRDEWLTWAVSSGRITDRTRGAWAATYAGDPHGTVERLKALEPVAAAPAPATALERWQAGETNFAKGQPASLAAGVRASADERSVLPGPASLLGGMVDTAGRGS